MAGKKGKLIFGVVCLLCIGAGAAVPMFVDVPGLLAKNKEEGGKDKKKGPPETATVPFGEIMVNLAEDRMSRYLRVKVALVVEASDESDLNTRLTKHKAEAKSKLIVHLAGKTLKDVTGTVGVNRVQREIQEKIEDALFPDGGGTIKAVLFEEYVVQ